MPEPAIKNWRNFPPAGGWSVTYTLAGQSFAFTGSPAKIVEKIRKVQVANDAYVDDIAIWSYLNDVWCARDPQRCIRSMSSAAPRRAKASTVGRRSSGCGGCGGGRVR